MFDCGICTGQMRSYTVWQQSFTILADSVISFYGSFRFNTVHLETAGLHVVFFFSTDVIQGQLAFTGGHLPCRFWYVQIW